MSLEKIAQSYQNNIEKERGVSYNKLELSTLSATRFYTGICDAGPLGGGSSSGGGSIKKASLPYFKPLGNFASKPLRSDIPFTRQTTLDEYGIGVSNSGEIRPMKSTEVNTLRLDHTFSGLRLNEKIHPPQGGYITPSYELEANIKGSSYSKTLIGKGEINLYSKEQIKESNRRFKESWDRGQRLLDRLLETGR